MSRTIPTRPSLEVAREQILDLAEPGEPIEVSLIDALGMVLAEPILADVDSPPSDRAAREGYAVNSAEAVAGTFLRVAGTRRSGRSRDVAIEACEAIRVAPGDTLPAGANAVLRSELARPDPDSGPTRVIEVLDGVEPGLDVIGRGDLMASGSIIAPAGTRLRTSMVGLLASQGIVHPFCHRRVRVSVLAVGDHLVGPSEAPVMHRERNAANAALVSLALQSGAMPHDLQAVPESKFDPAFERATSAPVIIILGPASRSIARTLRSFGHESVVQGLAMRPGGRARHGVIRDDSGRVAHHVFQLPIAPVTASIAFLTLVRPLIARLQGSTDPQPSTLGAIWDGSHPASGDLLRAVAVELSEDEDGRRRARPITLRNGHDLPSFARAGGLALLPPGEGPWSGGERAEILPFD
ncbi:molybdopterin molybdotransferase MoeA [Tundrisphaera lichenicola]|uniref:molybdopterin molybdotransferase MoeA n=1 Tax=Tundrisphaera lichenicola TaxID=2029860 RepID=UPI003EB72D3B